MSVGNATQAINFDRHDLTLVLGENLDQGGDGKRNGVGKTTLINALSYGMYGSAISDIKLNNLVNKSNEKNMLVSVEFDIDDVEYRIERGRKPNLLKFYKNDIELKDDEAQGENKETQREIEKLLNLSHDMFKHTVALNTYTMPFLSMRAGDQKNIIEQLLGITVLSEKADALKAHNKVTKDQIKEEEFRLDAVTKANEHILEQIENLKRRQRIWIKAKDDRIDELVKSVESLMDLDVDAEIKTHKENDAEIIRVDTVNAKANAEADKYNAEKEAQFNKHNAEMDKHNAVVIQCNKWIKSIEADRTINDKRMQGLEKDIELINEHKCHSCGQDLHDAKQEEIKASKEKLLSDIAGEILAGETQEMEHKQTLAELGPAPEFDIVMGKRKEAEIETADAIETFYETVEEAHGHKSSLETLTAQLETATNNADPYHDQIEDMQHQGMQEVNYDEMNRLTELEEHQAFLLKLLTSKDSFIRKKIIEQNLCYLNNRLTHYLREIELPHLVHFMSDLSVEITDMGRDLDFDNLSRGERTRLILSLSLAFRDVWESLYSHINLLFVDELLDNGLDTAGVEAAIKIMKGMARERGKSMWLVSHRDELVSRVGNTMKVVKTGGFTEYSGLIE